ncbi:polysaccharide deacetylase family protein [Rhodoferax aquaticus]|uniref:NodB homology domain-containing protein n=1 Tax=Rhodoferax aquaticus TaxID=2527691 RepID=A0A515EK94_9BURK|nr:polysaccharide deacetylase family protein [Rhodoferax aquaticus]QDL53084.1 hypothetical protein EXZ61_02255 [Rhodoferax aquaticus]
MKPRSATADGIDAPNFVDNRRPRPFFKRFGPYLHVYIVLGFGLPALIYLTVMQIMGWRTPSFGIQGALSYIASSSDTVVLYTSPNTKTYFDGIGGKYEVLVVPWRNYFAAHKVDFKEVSDAAQLRKQKEGVLILPSALSLGPDERAEIAAFRLRGGAVLATWATGTRNSRGEWEGWAFMESLGAKATGEIAPDSGINHLIMNGESPVSHTLPAGQRILMSKTSEALLRFKGDMVAGRFMNWARITDDGLRDEGAVLYAEQDPTQGRTAVFAFAESTWESHPQETYALIDDTLKWLQRQPTIVRSAWPNGKQSAQIIAMDTEQGFENAVPFAAMMKSLDYPSTFYILTSVGKAFPDIVSRLSKEFELGFHGDTHTGFKNQTENVQEDRIRNMRADIAPIVPNAKTMTGFRAPTEAYDATTERLLQKNGFRHHTADPNRTEARLPIFAEMPDIEPEDRLVVLPRTQRDDINLYGEKLSSEQIAKVLVDDANLAADTGSLGLLSIHSQNFGPDSALTKAMPSLLVNLKQRKTQLWFASAGQVTDWWRERDRFKLSSKNSSKRLEFNITVTGQQPVKGGSLVIMLPQKGLLPTIGSTKIGLPLPKVSRIDEYRASVVFDSLNPGNYSYQATFTQ